MTRRHEKPIPRTNPSGRKVWIARYTGRDGKRRSAGTFELKRDAQAAIDAAYDREFSGKPGSTSRETVGAYAATWLTRHPRTPRTETGYTFHLRVLLALRSNGTELRDFRLADIRRPEVVDVLDGLLRSGRALSTCRAALAVLSALFEDAMGDGLADFNPVRGIKIRKTDPRVETAARPVRVWSWEDMRAFAAAMPGPHGPVMGRVLSDCGLRIGELLALHRSDVEDGWLLVRRTTDGATVEDGTKGHRDGAEVGRRTPLARELQVMLRGLPPRLDTRLLFPGPDGGPWSRRMFYRHLWAPARRAVPGMVDARPHEFRHSYVSLMRAAGVDPADLASWTGHTVQTATARYTHSTGSSAARARGVLEGRISDASGGKG